MSIVREHIICIHTDFVTKFLYFATKSWTLTGSCALISLIIARVEFEITIAEIIDTLQLKACNETVRKAVLKLGYRRKKKSLHASEQERPRCEGKTQSMEREYVRVRP